VDFSLASVALNVAGGLLGARNDPYLSLNFLVEIEGLLVGGFQEVTGLQVETEVEDYREGGVNDFELKFATLTTYPNLVLERGLAESDHTAIAKLIEERTGTRLRAGSGGA